MTTFKQIFRDIDAAPSYREVSGADFVKARDRLPKDLLVFVTPYSAGEYKKQRAKLYLSQDDRSGFALKHDGELVSVFSLPGAKQGRQAIEAAIKLGAKRIDYIDGFLGDFYKKMGFREYDRIKWDDEYAPNGWDYKKFGRPDIVFARL